MTVDDFFHLVYEVLGEHRYPNCEQRECLAADPTAPLLIGAGPGTGKTTVLVLRALRHVLVDQIPPQGVTITTFTRKAAKEIRTRLIDWGTPLIEQLLRQESDTEFKEFLRLLDINRFVTGTLDSLCEEALSVTRDPREPPPTVIETFAANHILSRRGEIYNESQLNDPTLPQYLSVYTNTGDVPTTLGGMTTVIRTLVDRFIQDDVDLTAFSTAPSDQQARMTIRRIYERYTGYLRDTNQLDFASLERAFLERLIANRLSELTNELSALLVDEYQDTNPLQESIYFELVKRSDAYFTVVGDDDQSLYRFRGATIDLFRDFSSRAPAAIGARSVTLHYLTRNYRSTPDIVTFVNSFIQNDGDFAQARIQPSKPPIFTENSPNRIPILGMFRPSSELLASDLADFLHRVFRNGGWPATDELPEPIRCASDAGDFGDAVLISHTVNEFRRPFKDQAIKPRFPWLLRGELRSRGVECFNPRGRALKDVREVEELLGLVLECLDPSSPNEPQGRLVAGMHVTNAARNVFRSWRHAAQTVLEANPAPVNKQTLRGIVTGWRAFTQDGTGGSREWPVLDVFYGFVPWIEPFQDDPEHQVYLEAITRCAAQAATFSSYGALLLRDQPDRDRSIQAVVRDVLAPIAEDLVDVDEDIIPSIPRDRFNIMTIHQAKGLEFPLVIVDVSSDFLGNYSAQRFRRFPDQPSSIARLEDDLSEFTPIGPVRTRRSAIHRTFEDLIRLYYVAYSRPQSVLMLVGLTKCLQYRTTIRHVATFWRQRDDWPWRHPAHSGKPPSLADNLPFVTI